MNEDIFKGNWYEFKGKVKQQWGKLTDDDITQINGSVEELQGCLQKRYGYQQEEAIMEVKRFFDTNNLQQGGNQY